MASKAMDKQEVLSRAAFLLERYAQVTVAELVKFCSNAITPQQAEDVLMHIAYAVGPGAYSKNHPLQGQSLADQLNQTAGMWQQFSGAIGTVTSGTPALPPTQQPKKKPKAPFKKGDRVEVLDPNGGDFPIGTLGTIIRVTENSYTSEGLIYEVALDGYDRGEGNYYIFETHHIKKYAKVKVTIDSVVLSEEKKEEIRASISQTANSRIIFDKWGFGEVFEKGTAVSLLFYGIPGTGKTLMAQAIADEADAELKIYSTADIESSEPGGAERMIRTIFQEASKKNKAGQKRVLLFDECDSLLMDRNELGAILGAQVNALLTEIEHFDGMIIFTTNRLGKLDTALERRLSAKIEFPFPDHAQRVAIWQRMIPKQAPISKDVDFTKLAQHKVAGGNIKNAVLNAARFAAYKKQKEITMQNFLDAIIREEKSQEAFLSAYNNSPHYAMHGFSKTGRGGLEIDKADQEISISKTISMKERSDED